MLQNPSPETRHGVGGSTDSMPPARRHGVAPWRRTGVWWRLALLISVTAMGMAGIRAGVELSERPGIPYADGMTQIYYVLGLFVFGGLDLGVPQGGPLWAFALLWASYFAAPMITTTAIIEGIVRILRPEAWRLWSLRGHVVVAGCGRLAQLFIGQVRLRSVGRRVLVIERFADSPHLQAVAEEPRTDVLLGDICSEAVLASLKLHRASRVLLLTGDDYANLDAASRICTLRPELAEHLVVHVSDIQLLRLIEQKNLLPGVRKFNGYRSAAVHLVHQILVPHFQRTQDLDTVVLAGFGRFGQTVLHQLQEEAQGLFQTVILIDLEVEMRSDVFAEQVGFHSSYRHQAVRGDVQDPAVWRRVESMLADICTKPVLVLGSGSDSVNIRTALSLSLRMTQARIVARCFDRSSFTAAVSEEGGFEIVSTSDLLLAGLDAEGLLPRH